MLVSTIKETKKELIKELVALGIVQQEAHKEAELIIQHATGLNLARQVLQSEQQLSHQKGEVVAEILALRRQHLPLQYCLGYTYFMGWKFFVKIGVFIPRTDTELLVEEVAKLCRTIEKPVFAEIGIGSGAVAISLLKILPQARAYGIDISDLALWQARQNARFHHAGSQLTLLPGDWQDVLPMNLDAVVANPPYIPISQSHTLPPEIILWEPHEALFGADDDGLSFYRKLSLLLPIYLKPGGFVAVEVGDGQANSVLSIFAGGGSQDLELYSDLSGIPRVISARAPKS